MLLNNPISLTVNNELITLTGLDIVIMDIKSKKLVIVRLAPFLKPIVLWKDQEYDNIGDYTQDQAESKLLEIFGPNIQEYLQSLVMV